MAIYRLNDVITFTKVLLKNTGAVTEADYSLMIKFNGVKKYLNSDYITFTIVQPTVSVNGSIGTTITVTADYEDGNYTVELHKAKTTGDSIHGWTSIVGSTRFSIEKALVTPLTF